MATSSRNLVFWIPIALLVLALFPLLMILVGVSTYSLCTASEAYDICDFMLAMSFVGFAWLPYSLAIGAIGAMGLLLGSKFRKDSASR